MSLLGDAPLVSKTVGGGKAAGGGRGDFGHALRAEWTKLRTSEGTGWLLLLAVVLTVAVGCGTAKAVKCPDPGCGQDAVRLALTGVTAGQAVIAVLAVLAVSGEYGTGMIRTTLVAVPKRITVLTAKATVLTVVVLACGTVAVLASSSPAATSCPATVSSRRTATPRCPWPTARPCVRPRARFSTSA